MCQYQSWEDDSPEDEDYPQITENGIEHVDAEWATQIEMLETRISNVEARVERLEARMQRLQRGMHVVCVLLLVTFAYAICK